jgi:hypothetical protein
MAAFLRKKFAQESKQTAPVVRQPDSNDRTSSSPSQPPLFAKFATGGTFKPSPPSPTAARMVVSSPMPLSNAPRRKFEPEPGPSYAHRVNGSAVAQGSRTERESEARVQRSQLATGRPVDFTSKPIQNSHATLTQLQSHRTNSDIQPPTPTSPTDTNTRFSMDKPLPIPVSTPPITSPSINVYPPTNRRLSVDYTNMAENGLSSHPEKPLPLPSKTSPPLPPPPPPPLRSNKGKDREVDYFTQSDFADPYSNAVDPSLPSLPVNHGPAYSLNPSTAPYLGKSLPSMPESQSTISTPNLTHGVSTLDSASPTRQIPSSPPVLSQNNPSSPPHLYPGPQAPYPHSEQPLAPLSPRRKPSRNRTKHSTPPEQYGSYGSFPDRNGRNDHPPPESISPEQGSTPVYDPFEPTKVINHLNMFSLLPVVSGNLCDSAGCDYSGL